MCEKVEVVADGRGGHDVRQPSQAVGQAKDVRKDRSHLLRRRVKDIKRALYNGEGEGVSMIDMSVCDWHWNVRRLSQGSPGKTIEPGQSLGQQISNRLSVSRKPPEVYLCSHHRWATARRSRVSGREDPSLTGRMREEGEHGAENP